MKSLIIRCDVKMGYYNNLEFIIGTIVIIIFTIYQTIKQYKENKRIKNANNVFVNRKVYHISIENWSS